MDREIAQWITLIAATIVLIAAVLGALILDRQRRRRYRYYVDRAHDEETPLSDRNESHAAGHRTRVAS
jgi:hypothetical protein